MGWTAITTRMGRRIALVLGLCTAVPLILFAFAAARQADAAGAAVTERRLTGVSSLYAEVIRSRLGVAESIVETLTANDVGYDSAALKQQVSNSRAFKSVVVVSRDGLLAGGETALRPSPAQLLALEAGQTILMPVTLAGQMTGVFMARPVSAAGISRLAFFELAPDWLWNEIKGLPAISLAVVDADGRVLHSNTPLDAETGRMFAEHITLSGERGGSLDTLAWQGGGQAWRGTLKHVPLVNERITAIPWGVVVYTPAVSFFERTAPIWLMLPMMLLGLCVCALLAARYLAGKYLPSLDALQAGLTALQA